MPQDMLPMIETNPAVFEDTRLATGSSGLDQVLGGGVTPHRLYLVEGTPGTGKTTLAVGFLLDGVRKGEAGLYVTLAETATELRAVAASHGWSLDGLEIFELASEAGLDEEQDQTLFHPSEVELGETVRSIIDRVTATRPARVVIDSLAELRLLAQSPLRYRRQIMALKHFFARMECTVFAIDDRAPGSSDLRLHSIAHGVMQLEQTITGYGAERRRIRVVKMRGIPFCGGFHDMAIERGGVAVFPRLDPPRACAELAHDITSTGIANLDLMLGGGVVRGTTTLFSGPAGVGKTTAAITYMLASLRRGDRVAAFLFDERLPTLLTRAAAVGLDLRPYLATGQLQLEIMDPAELSAGAFSHAVRECVEAGACTIVIDSLNAYLQAMPDDKYLMLQMHELLAYLGDQNVVTLLVLGQHGLFGNIRSELDLSYLADTVVMLRYFEQAGEVRKAISVVKTRTTPHENTIRSFDITANGVTVGNVLRGFSGSLQGRPVEGDDALPDTMLHPEARTDRRGEA